MNQDIKQALPPLTAVPVAAPAVYSKTIWMRLAGVKRTRFYSLPPAQRPLMVLVGDTEMVREHPDAWAARLAAQQAQEATRAAIAAGGLG